MALRTKGRADEKEPIFRGADGRDPAGSREGDCGRGGQEESGQRANNLRVATHFAGLEPNDVKKLKALEAENAKLKKLLAERDLEIEAMREVNPYPSPCWRRRQV